MNSVSYCKSWFRSRKMPAKTLTEEEAKTAHDNHEPYTAIVCLHGKPSRFIEVGANAVIVGFLDEHLREFCTYTFQKVDNDKMFLAMAVNRVFEGETSKVSEGSMFIFNESGLVEATREFYDSRRRETGQSIVDVSANYDKMPTFGDYESIARVERT